MMNRIMTSGVAAVALAASALFALPAAADGPAARATIATKVGDNTRLVVSVGHNDQRDVAYRDRDMRDSRYGYGRNAWGQTQRQADQLSRVAIQACRQDVQRSARYAGFRDVDFDSRSWTDQIGPNGFTVHFREVEFERGHGRDINRPVTCTVRQGRVVDIDGMPRADRGRLYSDRGVPARR